MFSRNKDIIVTIPKPCAEDWNKMQASDKGRFCLSCQQNVIDFTIMSNEEIIQHLTTYKNVCGRFYDEQLNVPLQVKKIERKRIFTKLLLSSIFSFFAFNNVKSQEIKEIKTETVIDNTIKDSLELKPKINETRNVSVDSTEEAGVYQEDEKSGLNVKGGSIGIHLPKKKSFKEKFKSFFKRKNEQY